MPASRTGKQCSFHGRSAESAQSCDTQRAQTHQYLGFPIDRGVFEAQVETSSSQRIAKTPLFVRTKHHERCRGCRYRPEFRHCNLPGAEDLKQQCFKTLIHFVEFVDEEHARATLVPQGTERPPFGIEIERM